MRDPVNSAHSLGAPSHGARVEPDGAALVWRASYHQTSERWHIEKRQVIMPVQEQRERHPLLDHSLGTNIHSSRYSSRPAPAQMNNAVKSSRPSQASVPDNRAIPPQTPPNQRSVRLRRKAFTVDASGSRDGGGSEFSNRCFARLNSSSVKPT